MSVVPTLEVGGTGISFCRQISLKLTKSVVPTFGSRWYRECRWYRLWKSVAPRIGSGLNRLGVVGDLDSGVFWPLYKGMMGPRGKKEVLGFPTSLKSLSLSLSPRLDLVAPETLDWI
jgi:hypothetical protein